MMTLDRLLGAVGLVIGFIGFLFPTIDRPLCATLMGVSLIVFVPRTKEGDSPAFAILRYLCIGWAAGICMQQILTAAIREDGVKFASYSAAELVESWKSGQRVDFDIVELPKSKRLKKPGSYVVQVPPLSKAVALPMEPVINLALDSNMNPLEQLLVVAGVILAFFAGVLHAIVPMTRSNAAPENT